MNPGAKNSFVTFFKKAICALFSVVFKARPAYSVHYANESTFFNFESNCIKRVRVWDLCQRADIGFGAGQPVCLYGDKNRSVFPCLRAGVA